MAIAPISAAQTTPQSAFGLDFQSLLQIILTQLTYQDPLKPMDNFQFVSQLAQFSQLQQSQSLNDQVTTLLTAQAATQATSLLGRNVDVLQGSTTLAGVVQAVTFASDGPKVTIKTASGDTIANLSLGSVTQVR
ncbi:flagellar hook assembly protein FlgD [Caulobacter sp. DWR1-3-2b1]|uniref:flagellar hook assembly protein FlgD n=1 Tax=Caulobacter sp. DWR1-3-2b1 TaxID=2804670 RepID=UPI003CF054DC